MGDTDHRADGLAEMGDNLPAVELGANRTAVAVSAEGDRTCVLLDSGTCISYCLPLVPSRFVHASTPLLGVFSLLGGQRSIVAGSDRELATPPVEEATPRTKIPGVCLFPAAFRYLLLLLLLLSRSTRARVVLL